MNKERRDPAAVDGGNFQVAYKTGKANGSAIKGDHLSVNVGQRVRLNGIDQMWDSVGVYAKGQPDGTLLVRVVVFNPDWDEPLQIACIRSRPDDAACLAALGCNLDHAAA